MEERADRGTADWALICLHTHYLGAVDAQTHVSAWEHYRVFGRGVADNAFALRLVGYVGRIVVYSIDVIQIHNLVIIEELLLQEFET